MMGLHVASSRVLGVDVLGGSARPSPGFDADFAARIAPDFKGLVQESERLGGMGKDGHEQLPAQPAVPRMGDLDDLLCKLSTWDGSSGTAHDDSTSSDGNGDAIWPSGESTHLEMQAMEPQDIDVILHLSDAGDGEDGEVWNGVEAEKIEVETDVPSSELSSTGEAPIGDEIVESSHVWYACYGSNMWKKRFMCYIEGGQVEGMTRSCVGCRDKTPPVASEWLSIPNRLFFGHERTRMWGPGGVAFLNPIPEPGVVSYVRIYKITMRQFNDVLCQENADREERTWMTGKHINELKKREPHYLMDIFGAQSWYGTVKFLGEKDGLPVLTFTCPESHMEKFWSGEFGTASPPDAYRNAIVHGLRDDLGFTEEQAHEYVTSATLPKKSHIERSHRSQEKDHHYY